MFKRILTILLAMTLTAAVSICPVFAEEVIGEYRNENSTGGYYYVYTLNGGTLNVRDLPNGRIVGTLDYGTRIYAYYNDGAWAMIDFEYDNPGYGFGTYACYVSSRYLVRYKPDPYDPNPADPVVTDPYEEINAEFKSARTVTPFMVTVRPTRASGWVNLRWAPSQQIEIMATYKAGERLQVIRETANWYQVRDEETGNVGFMMKKFVQ